MSIMSGARRLGPGYQGEGEVVKPTTTVAASHALAL
jgi:hypothetical protein